MTQNTTSTCDSKFRMKDIPPEYVVNIDNGQFIRFGGLLYLANQMGVFKCITKDVSNPDAIDGEITYQCEGYLIPSDKYLEQKGIGKDSPFIEMFKLPTITHGTTNPDNLKTRMVPFKTVMAETRAIARCLRILTECPLCSVEELGNYEFSAEEAISVAKSSGIELKSAQEMLNEPQHEPKTRSQFIDAISKLKKKPGVTEIINSYLGDHSAMIIQNLSDSCLQELYNLIIQFLAE